MTYKDTYFIKVWDDSSPDIFGLGECALFKGLSQEDESDYETRLNLLCSAPTTYQPTYSSIKFGFETAFADLSNGGKGISYPNTTWVHGDSGLPINGLIWMGDKKMMFDRIKQKLSEGFRCLKLKIGGIDFEDELQLIKYIRTQFDAETLELRLDANGAFTADNALNRLNRLSEFSIHSLEQPIKAGQIECMADVCAKSPIPIALDEELIGSSSLQHKQQLLVAIKPHYIILKPALCGGFKEADDWIRIAENLGIDWWATSALESNIGLNAIAQWVAAKSPHMHQGLGTGELYSNNIQSPVYRIGSKIYFDINKRLLSPFEL
jgi:o-succinylbenzoate synthase